MKIIARHDTRERRDVWTEIDEVRGIQLQDSKGVTIEVIAQMGGGFSVAVVSGMGSPMRIEPIGRDKIIVGAKP